MQSITIWLEEKIPYDLNKLGSLLSWTFIEILSILVDTWVGYNILSSSLDAKTNYDTISPSINESSGLVVSGVPKVYPVKSCTFTYFDVDNTPAAITQMLIMSIILLGLAAIATICFFVLLGLKIYKLIKSKAPVPNKKSPGNEAKSALGTVFDTMGIILLLCDDILTFVIASYIFAIYNGPTGYGCLLCLLQVTTCKKDVQYNGIVSAVQTLLLLMVIKTLMLIVKKMVLGFFNWTKTGTVFDLVILRLLATVMFTIFALVIIYTPGLYVLKTQYFAAYSITGTLAAVVNSISNIGLMMWAGILLIATCYPIMLIFTS